MKGAKIALFPNKTAILSGQYLKIVRNAYRGTGL